MKNLEVDESIVLIGVSAGGFNVIPVVLAGLDKISFPPIVIVQHVLADSDQSIYLKRIEQQCNLKVLQAEDKMSISSNTVYLAPPNYHLLIEPDKSFSLSIDPKVNHSRPSIDVLFESAIVPYFPNIVAIILTGANSDGTNGAKLIKENGGILIVQDPETAEAQMMPLSVINCCTVDYIAKPADVVKILSIVFFNEVFLEKK